MHHHSKLGTSLYSYVDYPISFFTDRPQEIQLQGLLIDQAAGSSGLYPSEGTWNQIPSPTIQIQQVYIYIYICKFFFTGFL
jgi:hypothetical protein